MKNKTLYVIGNGFDQRHGLKSSYGEYHKYVKNNDPNNIGDFLNQYFILKVEKDKKSGDYLWSDFENDLASFDAQQFYSNIDNVSEGFIKQETRQWSSYFGLFDEIVNETEKYKLEIKQSFWDWINEISETEIKRRNMDFDENAIFLSFNYTSTLEKVYDILNVFHIHGSVKGGNEEELVFGHGKEKAKGEIEELDENGESNRTPSFDAEAASHSLFYQLQKPVKNIINENQSFLDSLKYVERVVVLGHSLNEIDMPYICKIRNSISGGATWTIVCYTDSDIQRAENVMENIEVAKDSYRLLSWEDYEEGMF
ncbi:MULTISPECIES: bacteriophage abortive infection AbiH family protein [Bacteroides]|uniref:bacteriophage abortive infection AbiH family protein n=1 Tax=Bacteroides TaxID=816 RepID=UPI000E4A0D45|nr:MULTISPECIES: bacteriophage abortive infection AbiH family protein [Bacteroides]RGY28198.1 hypothetical protein DXA46_23830 [Bacteroides sp. OF02-3LB]